MTTMTTTTTIEETTGRPSLEIAREIYRSITLYSPSQSQVPVRIDVSDNTNLWGTPPAAMRAIHDSAGAVSVYPALYMAELKRAIADYLGVSPEMIVTGCGSDDVLDSAIRAFGEPGDVLAHMDPSFSMIPVFAAMNGVRTVAVPLTGAYDADAEAFRAAGAKIIYLCSPNNPTGTVLSRATVERIIDEARGLVIIDEAYAEFASATLSDLTSRSPHVLVTRTMSKAFGLAGLRVGYAVGNPALVAEVEKSRGPYKVNTAAERAAVAALTEDLAWVKARARESAENRDRMAAELHTMGLEPLPSEANFVLVPVSDAMRVDAGLRDRGIAVRAFATLPGIGGALRIASGPWPVLEECLGALRDVLRESSRDGRGDVAPRVVT